MSTTTDTTTKVQYNNMQVYQQHTMLCFFIHGIAGDGKSVDGRIRDTDGNFLEGDQAKRERLMEHFKEILTCDNPVDVQALDDQDVPNDTRTSMEEVKIAVGKLKNRKAPGIDNISAELLKYGGQDIFQWLHRVITVCWRHGKNPKDWKDGIVVRVPKKGDTSYCDNNRGITLLSIAGKVYCLILLARVVEGLDEKIMEFHNAFRKGRGCMDSIFSARRIMGPLYMCFVDLKKAYDSVNGEALWKVMETYDIPLDVIQCIKDLHFDTEVQVRAFGEIIHIIRV